MSGVRGLLLLALVVAAVAGVVTHSDWALLPWEPAALPESDYQLHWAAGRALVAGQDPYDASTVNAIGAQTGRPVTPFCAANPLVVRLFGLAGPDFAAGYRTWRNWNLALLAASVLVLAACLRQALGDAAGLAAALALALGLVALNDGTWMAFFCNQSNFVTLLAVALALRAAQSGRPTAEGALLAIAAVAKTSPALLLLVAALAGRWRTLFSGLATGAALVALSLRWNGAAVHERYLDMLGLRLGYAAQVPIDQFNNSLHDWNLAPNGLLSRAGQAGGWPAWGVSAGAWAVSAVVLVVLARWLWPRAGRARPDILAQYAGGVIATFLVSSVTWTTHLSLAALPGAWLVVAAWSSGRLDLVRWLLLGAGAAAMALLFVPLGTFGEDLQLHLDILLKADACIALFAVVLAWPSSPPTVGPAARPAAR